MTFGVFCWRYAGSRAALIAALSTLEAQSPRPIPLRAPDATLSAEFTGITSLRELRDGRAIVTDGREQRLLLADFGADSTQEIGRRGRGPGEYSMVGFVYATAGDSSIIADLRGRRWLLFDGPRIVVTVPPDAPAMTATQGVMYGADQQGHVLRTALPLPRPGVTIVGTRDSAAVTLVARSTGHVDTVARTRRRPQRLEVTMDADGKVTSSRVQTLGLLPPEERAVLFTDGWLAVARVDPFRVDWRAPNGQWQMGAPVPVPLVRMDAREKHAFLERNSGMTPPSDWPATIPPFPGTDPRALVPSSDGRLLIRRSKSAGYEGTRYLVVNRRGLLEGEISLSANAQIVAFGAHSAYVVTTDTGDIQHLRRHPWP